MKILAKERKKNLPVSNNLKSNKIRNYLLYAIGEIILVVIGILIAVGINNWTEAKAEKNRLRVYLNDYRQDLKIDSTVVQEQLRIVEAQLPAFKLVLSDSMTKDSLMAKPEVFRIVLSYSPFNLQNKGFTELKNYAAKSEQKTDTLVSRIVAEHPAYEDLLNKSLDRIAADLENNMLSYKSSQPWVADLITNNVTEEIVNYFLSNDYRNRVAIQYVLIYGNLKPFLEAYQNYIRTTLDSLNERLGEENES